MSRSFIDTNVFLYAFVNQDVSKKSVAARILVDAVRAANGYVTLANLETIKETIRRQLNPLTT